MKGAMVQAFAELDQHRSAIAGISMRQQFADDPERFKAFSVTFATGHAASTTGLIEAVGFFRRY